MVLVKNLIELSRPWTWITIILLVSAVHIQASDYSSSWYHLLISDMGIALIVFGGFAINDFFDRDIDRIVHPERLIPSSRLNEGTILWVSTIAFVSGLVLLSLIGIASVTLGFIATVLLIFYPRIKNFNGFLGNIVFSLLPALAVVYGFLITKPVSLEPSFIFLVATVFFVILSRELIKDIEDMDGEVKFRTTLPMVIGVRATLKISSGLLILGLMFILLFLRDKPSVLLFAIPVLVYGGFLVAKIATSSKDHATELIKMLKIGFIFMVLLLFGTQR
ncbi:UbiA family prenyltransferase [Candidatus Microgenomates bacterium]|nr:UbiA family prenyltransferase [Candidatus Microgenomates bacterium]